MKKTNKDKENKNIQYEEMEKVEEFSTSDFVKGVGIGIVIGATIIAVT